MAVTWEEFGINNDTLHPTPRMGKTLGQGAGGFGVCGVLVFLNKGNRKGKPKHRQNNAKSEFGL